MCITAVTQPKSWRRAEKLQLSDLRFSLAADWEYCLESNCLHGVFNSCDLHPKTYTLNGGKRDNLTERIVKALQLWDALQSCFFLWNEKILLLLCIYRYTQRASAWLFWVLFLICNMSKHECLCSYTFNKNQQFSLIKGLINQKQTRRNNNFRIHCSSRLKHWWTAAGDKKLSLILNCFATRLAIFNSNIKRNGFQQLLPNVNIWQIQNIISIILELHSCLCEYLFFFSQQPLLGQTDVLWGYCKPPSVLMCGENGFIGGAPCRQHMLQWAFPRYCCYASEEISLYKYAAVWHFL